MKLYHRDDCPFCWKVRIAFLFANAAPQMIHVDRGTKHPDIMKLSKTGTVPVFVDGDLVIAQSSVLLEYINEALADGKLLPATPAGKVAVRCLCYYSDNSVGPALRGLVFERRDKSEAEQDKTLIAKSDQDWRACLDVLEAGFVGPFMCGEFSMADCTFLPRLALAERYGACVDERHPSLHKYWQTARQSELYLNSFTHNKA